MSLFPRFYLTPEEWPSFSSDTPLSSHCLLSQEETHHLTHVLRTPQDATITLFDGQGREALATFLSLQKKGKKEKALVTLQSPPKKSAHNTLLILAQAIPKGKTMDLIIQKGVELGVSAIIPLVTERTIVHFSSEKEKAKKQERWQQIALEACKQSGQNYLPQVHLPQSLEESLAYFEKESPQQSPISIQEPLRCIASLEEGSQKLSSLLQNYQARHTSPPSEAILLIGPEGDFTPKEYERAQEAQFLPLSLGPIILRTETAALYGLSILGYELF
jgi:16S rRNA (uracil1498-N3)-methyltransferase